MTLNMDGVHNHHTCTKQKGKQTKEQNVDSYLARKKRCFLIISSVEDKATRLSIID